MIRSCFLAGAFVTFASKHMLQQVTETSASGLYFTRYRYFPGFYPDIFSSPYSTSYSVPTVMRNGMNWLKTVYN